MAVSGWPTCAGTSTVPAPAARPTPRATYRGRSSSTSTLTCPTPLALAHRAAIPSPRRPPSSVEWRPPGSARMTWSSPTTTRRASTPPACGGCSTTSAIAAVQAILDGGLQAWLAAGQPLSTEVPELPPATLKLGDEWHNVISRDDLAGRLGLMDLLDARAGERYRGEVEPIDLSAGHIPTAISAPTAGNLGADGRMLTPPRAPPPLRSRCSSRDAPASCRAAAARPPATTRWRCASRACATRCCMSARSATGAGAACRSPWAANRASLRSVRRGRPGSRAGARSTGCRNWPGERSRSQASA